MGKTTHSVATPGSRNYQRTYTSVGVANYATTVDSCALPDHFWAKVNKTDTCWLWTGSIQSTGYGTFSVSRRMTLAHRLTYEAVRGPIPAGLVIDHLCRVHNCVNPEHLEAVTYRENARRGIKGVLTTHCPEGHAYDEANTYYWKHRGFTHRDCRECNRIRSNAYYRARKEVQS